MNDVVRWIIEFYLTSLRICCSLSFEHIAKHTSACLCWFQISSGLLFDLIGFFSLFFLLILNESSNCVSFDTVSRVPYFVFRILYHFYRIPYLWAARYRMRYTIREHFANTNCTSRAYWLTTSSSCYNRIKSQMIKFILNNAKTDVRIFYRGQFPIMLHSVFYWVTTHTHAHTAISKGLQQYHKLSISMQIINHLHLWVTRKHNQTLI